MGGAADTLVSATLINSTTVKVERGMSSGSSIYSFFVVEFK
jgi:hypothetical protein